MIAPNPAVSSLEKGKYKTLLRKKVRSLISSKEDKMNLKALDREIMRLRVAERNAKSQKREEEAEEDDRRARKGANAKISWVPRRVKG